MSELSGGNNEEPNENEEFDFGNLDNEWAEFSESLAGLADEEALRLQMRAMYKVVEQQTWDLLEEQQVPRVIHPDADMEYEMYQAYSAAFQRRKLEGLGLRFDEIDEAQKRKLHLESVHSYFEEREFEAMLFENIAMMRFAFQHPESSETTLANMFLLKKRLQIELTIYFGRGLDDPWQLFLSKATPTDELGESSSLERILTIITRENLPDIERERVAKQQLLDEAKAIIGLDEDHHDLSYTIQTIADIFNLRALASQPIYTENDRANRNARLWGEVRNMQLTDDVARSLVKLFDDAYPIDNSDLS